MTVQNVSLDELKPYENNPRKNDGAVEAVAKSIEQFGFKVPIVINADNVIVAGHTRYKAAQKLGLESVPCIVADDLTPVQIKAFRLADNKIAELATWDFEKLDDELAALHAADLSELTFDMNEFGFDVQSYTDIDDFFEEIHSDRHEADRHEADRHEADRHEADRHEADRHEADRRITCPYCKKKFSL